MLKIRGITEEETAAGVCVGEAGGGEMNGILFIFKNQLSQAIDSVS